MWERAPPHEILSDVHANTHTNIFLSEKSMEILVLLLLIYIFWLMIISLVKIKASNFLITFTAYVFSRKGRWREDIGASLHSSSGKAPKMCNLTYSDQNHCECLRT